MFAVVLTAAEEPPETPLSAPQERWRSSWRRRTERIFVHREPTHGTADQ